MAVGETVGITHGFKVGSGGVVKNRFVKLSALETVVQTALATDKTIGVADVTVTTGDQARGKGVNVKMGGILLLEAGASTSLGDEIMSDTSGRAITAATTGNRVLGIGLKAATGAGDQIPVLFTANGRVL